MFNWSDIYTRITDFITTFFMNILYLLLFSHAWCRLYWTRKSTNCYKPYSITNIIIICFIHIEKKESCWCHNHTCFISKIYIYKKTLVQLYLLYSCLWHLRSNQCIKISTYVIYAIYLFCNTMHSKHHRWMQYHYRNEHNVIYYAMITKRIATSVGMSSTVYLKVLYIQGV